MRIANKLLWMIIILSTTFVFFQSAAIVRIDYLLVAMCVLCVLFVVIKKKVVTNCFMLLYVIILTLMGMSLIYTVSLDLTTTYLYVMVYGLILWVVVSDEKNSAEILIKTLVAFSMINVYITLCSSFFSSAKTLIARILPDLNTRFLYASGILGQTGTNAYVIAFSVLYMATKLLSNQKKNYISLIFFLASGILALVLTGKRGPILWVCVAIVIIDFLQNKVLLNKISRRKLVIYVGAIVSMVLLLMIMVKLDMAKEALERFIPTAEDFTSGRFELYMTAIGIFKKNILFGIGAGAYNFFGMGAHNDYLQMLAEDGFFCATLFFVFVIWNLFKTIKGYRILKNEKLLYLLGLQIFFILNALTGTTFLHYGFYIIYTMVCASCYSFIRFGMERLKADVHISERK